MNARVLVPAAIAIGLAVSGDSLTVAPALRSTLLAIVLVGAVVLLPLALPALLLRRPDHARILRAARILEMAPVLLYALTIVALGWTEVLDRTSVVEWPVVWAIARLLPYGLLRATAEISRKRVMNQLRPDPASPLAWALTRLRQETLLFAPFLLLCVIEGVVGWGGLAPYAEAVSAVHWVGLLGNVTLLIMFFPILLRWAFSLPSLQRGAERAWIERYFAANGFRVRDILLWPGGAHFFYAGLVGILPSARYLVLSRGLLDLLTPAELEAVVAHEMGHGVKRHAGQAVRAAGTLMVLVYLSYLLVFEHHHPLLNVDESGVDFPALLVVMVTILPSLAMMRALLRHFELEADLFAATKTGRIEGLVWSLDKMASAIGMHRDRASFRHPSIATRQRFLENAALGGSLVALRFTSLMRRTRLISSGVFVATLILLARQVAAESTVGLAAVAMRQDRGHDAERYLEWSLKLKHLNYPAWLLRLELDLAAPTGAVSKTLDVLMRFAPRDASARGEIAQAIDELRAEQLANGELAFAHELRGAVLALATPELR